MPSLSQFRLLGRIMAIAGCLAIVPLLMAALAIGTLSSRNSASRDIEKAALRALAASKMAVNATAMNSNEFQLAGNPNERTLEVVRVQIGEHLAELKKHFRDFSALAEERDRNGVDQVARLVADYEREIRITLKVAGESVAAGTAEAAANLRREAEVSQEVVGRLTLLAKTFAVNGEARVTEVTDHVVSLYSTMATIIGVLASVGILAGLGFIYFAANNWVAAPIRAISDVLRRLAQGELPLDINGTERRDEVGDLARAAMGLRERCLELRRLKEGVPPQDMTAGAGPSHLRPRREP